MNISTPLAPLFSLEETKANGDSKKKRVLLVDASSAKRDLRADAMRKLGVNVDCAADIAEARSWWRADLYDLVLINLEKGSGYRDKFCDDVRGATPPQKLAFLVGKPEYLADAPGADAEFWMQDPAGPALTSDVKAVASASLPHKSQHWGILEASRRISAVRSACAAHTQAMRDRPTPPRDLEGRPSKRTSGSDTLDDLLRKELQ
ncbi:MAG TPA: response regulator [Candidatus Sulfotelmatobacter sp.]|jgi:CheY-like chemotaxis protein